MHWLVWGSLEVSKTSAETSSYMVIRREAGLSLREAVGGSQGPHHLAMGSGTP